MTTQANPTAAARPLIGCTTYRRTLDIGGGLEVYGLASAYIKAIERAGGIPLLIPLGLDDAALRLIFGRLDGVLLPGGGDVDPREYNGRHHETCYGIDRDRDRIELFMAREAVAREKPLLAVCRGLQVVNVALGGTLWEDVNKLMPNGMKHAFHKGHPRNYLPHSVDVMAGSKLAHCLGRVQTPVNSLHHQGVRDLAPDLQASAVAPDGLIEAIEVPDHPFALGVQWHPENLVDDDPAMLRLFRGLVEAAANGRGPVHTDDD